MNTLLFTIEYPPFKGGVAKYYELMVDNWPEKEGIFVLHNNNNNLISKYFLPRWLPSFYQLYKTVRKHKIDHVLVGHILPLGTVSWLMSKFMGFKYSLVVHGMDLEFSQKSRRKKCLAKIILKRAEKIIANSKNTKDITQKILEEENSKIIVVNPSVSLEAQYSKQYFEELTKKYNPKNKLVLLTLGRLVKRKGQDNVIDIMNSSNNFNNEAVYLIAGKGPDEQYFKNKAKQNSNIFFLGLVSDKEKWSLLHFCDIFIMPAREKDGDVEGFGIVYIEAGLAKKPVIAGRSGGVTDAVLDNETGILCNPDSKKEIELAIKKLKENPALRNKLGEKAFNRAKKDFNPKNFSQKIYSSLK